MQKDKSNDFVYYKRNLPHFQYKDNPIFITWRLAFNMTPSIEKKLQLMKTKVIEKLREKYDLTGSESKQILDRMMFNEFDKLLDSEKGLPKLLSNPILADIVKHVLHFNDKRYYNLLCYCIMPNHVHALISIIKQERGEYALLPKILKNWKGISARLINKELSRTENVWQDESYDHIVRNDVELKNIVEYIIYNPVQAGMVSNWSEWPHTYVSEDIMSRDD